MKIKEYKAIRESGMELSGMIFNYAAENKQAIISSAKILGFWDGKSMVFQSDSDSETMMDFMVFEKSTQNDPAYQRFYRTDPKLDVLQQENMNGILHFHSSLFEVKSIDPIGCTIVLEDILNASGKEYQLMDIGMSKTIHTGFVLFTRLIPIRDVHMTSGVSFGFDKSDKGKLLSAISMAEFKKRRKLSKTELYILFHEKNRQYGVETRTE